MYPEIFMHNIETGSSTIRCDCSKNCVSKKEKVGRQLEKYFLDQTVIEESDEKLLYKNDSTAIEKWSQQVGKYNPHLPLSVPVQLYDHLMALPSPPVTPRKRILSTSSCSTELWNVESNKPKSGLNLLAGTADFIENNPAYNSWYCSTPWSAEYKDEFSNLIMLAEEAFKRIELQSPTKWRT